MSNTQSPSSAQTGNPIPKAKGTDDAPLANKMKDTLHSSVDTLAEKAESAEKAIRSGASNSAEALNEKQQQIQESWEASSVRKYAVENPVATAGIVFIAGALFGKFMSRN